MSLMDILKEQLGGAAVGQISQQLGADEQTTQSAITAALPAILAGLAKNTSKPDGAEALHGALSRDHDGSIFDNLAGLIGNPQAGNGDGILQHVLGGRRGAVETGISKTTGLEQNKTASLMSMLAPAVLGALGQQQKQQGLNAGSLANLLGQERDQVAQQAPQSMGLLQGLLDSDGDGDVDLGDLAGQGSGMLGKLFGR